MKLFNHILYHFHFPSRSSRRRAETFVIFQFYFSLRRAKLSPLPRKTSLSGEAKLHVIIFQWRVSWLWGALRLHQLDTAWGGGKGREIECWMLMGLKLNNFCARKRRFCIGNKSPSKQTFLYANELSIRDRMKHSDEKFDRMRNSKLKHFKLNKTYWLFKRSILVYWLHQLRKHYASFPSVKAEITEA